MDQLPIQQDIVVDQPEKHCGTPDEVQNAIIVRNLELTMMLHIQYIKKKLN
jgi:hypothetical protein